MNNYRIIAYLDGIKVVKFVKAENKDEAEKLGYEIFDADSIYVSEVQEDDR